MFIYTAGRKKVKLDLVKSEVGFYEGESFLRVALGEREYTSRLSEQVTRSAQQHLEMPGRLRAVRAVRAARLGAPPAVFEEEHSRLTRVVYKEVVIRFAPKIPQKRRRQILAKHGLKIRRENAFVRDQVVAYDATGKHTGVGMIDVANDCAEMVEVVFATPNFISQYRRDAIPLIPVAQWHLHNRGKVSGQVKDEDVNAREAWKITQGKRNITIAVLDDGVDVEHPNLKSNIKKNPDPKEPLDTCGRDFFVPDDHPEHFNPRPKRFQWPYYQMTGNDIHGTPCAGVVSAVGKDALGIAPKCRILPVKIFHADDLAPDARVADAIRYAARHADILSCSWSGPASPDIEVAIQDAGTIGREEKGSAVFCASGNGAEMMGEGVSYPAAFDEAIAVGASTDTGKRAGYSQYGAELWIVAPSNGGKQEIYTTDVGYDNRGFNIGAEQYGGADGLHTNGFGGTSSATPLAAGIGALILSVKPSLDRDQVAQILAATADKIGSGYNSAGWSKRYGYGRVNAVAAVEAASAMKL
ncbi:MAG: S8 family serine peptidase [bacterium]|nr:MAG: S8 family serine peptidase [bacterium]